MHVRSVSAKFAVRSGVLILCAAMAIAAGVAATGKRPMKNPKYDPKAESVELFDGIDRGTLVVTLIPKNSQEGNVFIENKSDKPVTVKLPQAVAAVQVLKQGFGGGGAGGIGGQKGGGGQGGGGGQSQGGGMGGGGMGGGGMGGGGMGGGGGGNFFSVPSEKVVQIPFFAVCLNHGKPDPKPKMTYKLVKLESYTTDPVLQQLLIMVGTGKLDKGAAQAAAWHLTDKMSWEELSAKRLNHVGGLPSDPYFTEAQLAAAQQLVGQAEAKAKEIEKNAEGAAPRNRVKE